MEEMGSKVASLEASLAESREKTAAAPSGQGLHRVWWSLNSFSLDKNDVTEGGGDDVHDDDGDNDGDDDGDGDGDDDGESWYGATMVFVQVVTNRASCLFQ